MEELNKQYEPQKVEDHWYAEWLKKGYFTPDASSKKDPYCIVIPPPNVTGVLTMGHVLNNTLQDILCRRKRMQGFEVLWLPGTDHAGIATQTVVERTLKKEGSITHRDDLGREKFVEKIWEWKRTHGNIIIKQLKKLGCSCDWTKEVFTMDGLDPENKDARINYPHCVKKVFVDLYNKGNIYCGEKMVNWCPVSRTALSDEEVEMKEVDSHLWHLKYPVIDEEKFKKHENDRDINWAEVETSDYVVVATTRPETMLGDEAIAVNPKDKRYEKLIGKRILLPLKNKLIPVIADDLVEMEFGTGVVKVTPAHDPADYEMGLKHKLPITQVIAEDGTMTAEAGEKYEGLDRYECREAVVSDLQHAGLMEKIENYKHNVGYSQRADVPVEPMISKQWFLKYPEVEKSLNAVTKGDVKFWPDRWVKVYSHWLENIRDWCISRQLWWGHRIPAWYCNSGKDCEVIVAENIPEKCPHCGSTDLKQDPDVLDTWFSSWLWPFATMGWPEENQLLNKFYPTTDLVTGPDIIFFWVARMIMAGYEFMGKKPFDNVYFTGIIRDSQGRKMSKSLGNSPNPLDIIDRFGADGLRFGLMLIAPKGQDILFSEDRIEVGRNFMNKLWNASRFVLMNVGEDLSEANKIEKFNAELKLSLADKWIVAELGRVSREVNKALDEYQFDTGVQLMYHFVWGAYCDWYVELAKTQLASTDDECKINTKKTLIYVLDGILKLMHPFAPFITEEIWQKLGFEKETITFGPYPEENRKHAFENEVKNMQLIMDVINSIRNIRGEHSIKPGKKIDAFIVAHDKKTESIFEAHKYYINDLAKVESLSIVDKEPLADGATAVAGTVEVFVPFAGLIDVEEEKTRLAKEIAKVASNIERINAKLSNKNFVAKAPATVVLKEKERIADAEEELKKLEQAKLKLG